MSTNTAAERVADIGDSVLSFVSSGLYRCAWPCQPAVRHEGERTAVERDARSTSMQSNSKQEQYSRRPTAPYTDARREIGAAIHRVQREGQTIRRESRTIIREVPTMPERILSWECPRCGPTIRQDSDGWHKCRLCGQDAVRRTWIRPDIKERRAWPRRTKPWYGRSAASIRGRT